MNRLIGFSPVIFLAWTFMAAKAQLPDSKPSARLGDLLITLTEIEDPARQPGYVEAHRHEVLIQGTVKNVGKKPVCSTLEARLETSSKLDEFATTTFLGKNQPWIQDLAPEQERGARFVATVNNGSELLNLRINLAEPDQGCDGHRHHISKPGLTIALAAIPKIQAQPSADSSAYLGEVLTVGGAVSQPRIKYQTEPEFSEEARKAGRHGTVVLKAIVGTDGTVHDLRIIRSEDHKLDQKALTAVSQWIFDPAVKDGRKVPVYVDIEVSFQLY